MNTPQPRKVTPGPVVVDLRDGLPRINPEHADFLQGFVPSAHLSNGHQEFRLVGVNLDLDTGETVATYEAAAIDCVDMVRVHTMDARIRDGRLVLMDRKPVYISARVYNATRGTKLRIDYGR